MKAGTIWHLSSNRWNSAITEYALSCAKSLRDAGYNNVFSPLAGTPGAQRASREGLSCVPLDHVDWRDFSAAKRLMLSMRPTHVFTYGGPETALVQMLPHRGVEIIRVRGQGIEAKPLFRLRHQLAHRSVSHMLTPSARLAQDLSEKIGRQVDAVMLGCDTKKYHRIAPILAPTSNRPELVVLGRLDPVKGHAVIFDLHRRVLDHWPEGRPKPLLHIVGQPANLGANDLQRLALASRLTSEVDWRLTVERVADVAELMSAAAIGVIPSIGSEIICRTAEEFLLCGTPVAVSGVGSLNEVLFPNAGVSYYGVDAEQAALLIRDLLLSSLLEGEAAKVERAKRARDLFSLDAMARRLEQVLGIAH